MPKPQSHVAPYAVTATTPLGLVQQTRVTAAPAIVLARTWIAQGYSNVSVRDAQGNTLNPLKYRPAALRRNADGRD